MENVSIASVGFYAFVSVVNVIAFWKLLPRAGIAPGWSVLAFFTPVAIIMFWMVAFRRWPGEERSAR